MVILTLTSLALHFIVRFSCEAFPLRDGELRAIEYRLAIIQKYIGRGFAAIFFASMDYKAAQSKYLHATATLDPYTIYSSFHLLTLILSADATYFRSWQYRTVVYQPREYTQSIPVGGTRYNHISDTFA